MKKILNFATVILITFTVMLSSVFVIGVTAETTAPKNVIFMIGDGMGPNQVNMAHDSIGTNLNMENMPFKGTISTTNASNTVTDSAAGGTALACGVRTWNGFIGMDRNSAVAPNIREFFAENDKKTGFVTTTSVTDATPAAFGTHNTSRNNQTAMAADYIANDIDVIMGGGTTYFNTDLINTATTQKGYSLVSSRNQLLSTNGDRLLALFTPDKFPYYVDGYQSTTPTLEEMTKKSIEVLNKNANGFFLMVEGGNIDHAGHDNKKAQNIGETLEFDKAIKAAMDFAATDGNTLIIVTADHETGGLLKNGTADYTFTSVNHTGADVPVYAIGTGASNFTGDMLNTDISLKIKQLYENYVPTGDTNTVTFDSGGGTTVLAKTVVRDSNIKAPTSPIKSGNTFGGWYTDATSGVRITFPYKVSEDVTLYAHWSASQTGSNLIKNGDFETPMAGNIAFSENSYIPGIYTGTPVTDPKFTNWFRVNDGNAEYHDAIRPETSSLDNYVGMVSQTLLQGGLALQNSKTYQITFRAKAGAVTGTAIPQRHVSIALYDANTKNINSGTSAPLAIKTENKTTSVVNSNNEPAAGVITTVGTAPNSYFYAPLYEDGWYTYTLKFALADNAIVDGHSFGIAFSNDSNYSSSWYYMYLDDVVLKEIMSQTSNKYTVAFNSQGGSLTEFPIVEPQTVISAPADPTKAGFNFDGWYTAAIDGTKVSFPYTVTDNATFYAHWAEIVVSYTTTFDSQGGSKVDAVISNGVTKIPEPTAPTKAGYTFDGWYNAPTGGEKITFPYSVGYDSTLYAHWTVAPAHTPGDVSGDGIVDLIDVTTLSRNVAGWTGLTFTESALDVNGDGVVDLMDVTLLSRSVAGWDVTIH